jgi:hypothetical protein
LNKERKSLYLLLNKIVRDTLRGEMFVAPKHDEFVDSLIEHEFVTVIEQPSLYDDTESINLHLMATDSGIQAYIDYLCGEK